MVGIRVADPTGEYEVKGIDTNCTFPLAQRLDQAEAPEQAVQIVKRAVEGGVCLRVTRLNRREQWRLFNPAHVYGISAVAQD